MLRASKRVAAAGCSEPGSWHLPLLAWQTQAPGAVAGQCRGRKHGAWLVSQGESPRPVHPAPWGAGPGACWGLQVCGFSLQTYSQLAHPIQQARALGLQFHSRILDIDNVDVSVSPWGCARHRGALSLEEP